jgi:hypothetical protein
MCLVFLLASAGWLQLGHFREAGQAICHTLAQAAMTQYAVGVCRIGLGVLACVPPGTQAVGLRQGIGLTLPTSSSWWMDHPAVSLASSLSTMTGGGQITSPAVTAQHTPAYCTLLTVTMYH